MNNTISSSKILKESKDWHTSIYRQEAAQLAEAARQKRQAKWEVGFLVVACACVVLWTWGLV